jgi:hypothetical protein
MNKEERMRQLTLVICGLGAVSLLAGCRAPTRIATRITEVPRVDLELSGGNRGYLVGTPPEPARLKTTRQMLETDIEIPSWYRPAPGGMKGGPDDIAPPETEAAEARGAVEVGRYDTYVVQPGDSLWSIAAKPQIYGKAAGWRRIFDANRELLKGSPDRLRAGMTLKIPRRDGGAGGTTFDEESTTDRK